MNQQERQDNSRRRTQRLVSILAFVGIAGAIGWTVYLASRPVANKDDGSSVSPQQIDAWVAEAENFERDGHRLKAAESYRRVLTAQPTSKRSTSLRHRLIEALIMLGDASAARTELAALGRQTLSQEDSVRILVHESRICRLEGRPQKALEFLDRALPQLGFMPEAVCERGILHLELGNLKEAVRDLEATLRSLPNHEIAHFKLASTYRRLKQPQNALRHHREYQRIHEAKLRESDRRRSQGDP